VQVGGVLDLATTPDVRSTLQYAMDDGARTVVLDFTGVRVIDSTALGMIVWLHKQPQERGGHVCVAAPQPLVVKVLELTSVDRLIRIYHSVAAAEDDLSTAGQR
jgi:anti-sigma B factor antagonist